MYEPDPLGQIFRLKSGARLTYGKISLRINECIVWDRLAILFSSVLFFFIANLPVNYNFWDKGVTETQSLKNHTPGCLENSLLPDFRDFVTDG